MFHGDATHHKKLSERSENANFHYQGSMLDGVVQAIACCNGLVEWQDHRAATEMGRNSATPGQTTGADGPDKRSQKRRALWTQTA
jgi:hypothetical protein